MVANLRQHSVHTSCARRHRLLWSANITPANLRWPCSPHSAQWYAVTSRGLNPRAVHGRQTDVRLFHCACFSMSLLIMSRFSMSSQASQRQVSVCRWHSMQSFALWLKARTFLIWLHVVQQWHAVQRRVQFFAACPALFHCDAGNALCGSSRPHTPHLLLPPHFLH